MEGDGHTVERDAVQDTREAPAVPGGVEAGAAPDPFEERPELYLGAAFAGGLLLALVLRRLRR